jgi:hypothetical protein
MFPYVTSDELHARQEAPGKVGFTYAKSRKDSSMTDE